MMNLNQEIFKCRITLSDHGIFFFGSSVLAASVYFASAQTRFCFSTRFTKGHQEQFPPGESFEVTYLRYRRHFSTCSEQKKNRRKCHSCNALKNSCPFSRWKKTFFPITKRHTEFTASSSSSSFGDEDNVLQGEKRENARAEQKLRVTLE